ncbi:major capsid protein P2 [Photobacterium sanguinicancri]|uniref:major capsid protein P2 n=1 Tax=Photobacterium TaxID=657 RepID=UPI003D0BCB56
MELVSSKFAPKAKELDPVEGVGWGNRCSLRLPAGPTYHSIELVTDITDPKDIERIEVVFNGSPIYNISAETLIKVNKHRKSYAVDGRYVIPFGDDSLRTKIGVRQSDLVTLPNEIWFIYISLKSKSATTPSIRARAHVLPAQSDRYYLPRMYELSWFAAAAGRTPFDFAEKSPFIFLKRVHFKDDSVQRVRLLRDDLEEINVRKEDNAFDLASSGQEQNPKWFSLDFCRTGFGADGMLPTSATRQLQFELDKTETGSVPVIIESIEQVKLLPSGE